MILIAASLLALSLAPPAEADLPADFLKVDSPAWNEWLDEDVNTAWGGSSLKSALATSFGAADLDVGNTKALDRQIKFDASNMTRRVALWHLGQKYGFTIRWAEQGEPRMFMGLSEAEHQERQIGGVTMTVVTQVMRSDYKDYLDLRQRGEVVEEEMLDDMLYYATNVDRDPNFGDVTGHAFELQRYKTTVPPEEVRTEARFTAKVRWTEPIGRREAEVISIGVDPRWLVGIEILSINRSAERFDKKGNVVLAIHSPVRVFQVGGKETLDKVYEFKMTGSMRHGQVAYHYANASERTQPPELPLVQVEAEVIKYIPQALHEDYEDGGFATFDAVQFKITSPSKWRGTTLRVYCNLGRANLVFRSVGSSCRFKIKQIYLVGSTRNPKTGEVTTIVPFDTALEGFQPIK